MNQASSAKVRIRLLWLCGPGAKMVLLLHRVIEYGDDVVSHFWMSDPMRDTAGVSDQVPEIEPGASQSLLGGSTPGHVKVTLQPCGGGLSIRLIGAEEVIGALPPVSDFVHGVSETIGPAPGGQVGAVHASGIYPASPVMNTGPTAQVTPKYATRWLPSDDAAVGVVQAAVIELRRVRAAQIGDGGVQRTTFIAQASTMTIRFDALLASSRVTSAVRALRADPDSAELRSRLIERLSTAPGSSNGDRLVVARRTGFFDFLRELLLADVVGLQVGDFSRQESSFYYRIPRSPSAAALLHVQPDLAGSLADLLCPPPRQQCDSKLFQEHLRVAVEQLEFEPAGKLRLGVWCPMPPPGVHMVVADVDGLGVGDVIQLNEQVTDIAAFRTDVPIPSLRPLTESLPPVTTVSSNQVVETSAFSLDLGDVRRNASESRTRDNPLTGW
ncbi:hypothetical protein [Paractinoplanes hotanensis]|uniref:Uncharacterized protein n=1 Tax=Paractinoplanes hotanensis TaxID=2906497 RepID=A0ABT0YDN1_9ACTN|nr:hypothetical protein [Actinoplanes hotanensis]MCM4083895.1 hypothetical protein [Actinoplanes hotanensis]